MLRFLYTAWGFFCFAFIFVLIFPMVFVCLQRESWKPYAHYLNSFVPIGTIFLIGIKPKVTYKFHPDPKKPYVFCSNHFSFFDIVSMQYVVKNYFAFVGKKSITKVPLFGYMFKRLHIYVDRDDNRSRVVTLRKAVQTLSEGRSIVIYPEGGIIKDNQPPKMNLPLTDGAFQMAVRQQVPIVPIAFLNNHLILPDHDFPNKTKLRLYREPFEAIMFEPIETIGLTTADIPELRDKYYQILDDALQSYAKK
jgi:1-acyl-sn-glycerol-3-phosphate acyltransferase